MTGSRGRSSTPCQFGSTTERAITGCPTEPVIGRPFGRPVGGHDAGGYARWTILVKIMARSVLSKPCYPSLVRVGGSHDGRGMVRFRNADALSADDRIREMDRVSPL